MSKGALSHIERGQEAFSRGDLSVMAALTTPDAEWGATGIFPGIGDHYRGTDAIGQWAEIERLCGRGRLSGVEVEMSVYSAYWFTDDGQICKRAAFAEPDAALEAAGVPR